MIGSVALPTCAANVDLVNSLTNAGARFLVIGGLAVRHYIPTREADDIDLLIEPSVDTAEKVLAILAACPFTANNNITVAQLTQPPRKRIPLKAYFYADLLTPGLEMNFAEHWAQSQYALIGTTPVKVAAVPTLLLLLSQSQEPKHLHDIAALGKIVA